jgi:hypothetical protein
MGSASFSGIAMRQLGRVLRPVLLLVAMSGGMAHAQQRQDGVFTWNGVVEKGALTYVKNVNGVVRVERSSSNKVEISASKSWRRGNPDEVRIEARRVGGGGADLLVCALWSENSSCDERGMRTQVNGRWTERNDVSVEFVVRVPDGVRVDVNTVNGAVDIRGVSGDVSARTVNGNVDAASTGGPVTARTVNGDVRVRMSKLGSAEELNYETVNGSVTVELPQSLGASVDLSTVNGRVSSDFPMTVSGTVSPRRIRATIGDGKLQLRVRTVNGSVELRKGM